MNESVLFICIGNSARSQMAEAFLRHYAGDRFDVYSAGIRPNGEIHPLTRKVMREAGIDLFTQHSKGLRELYMLRNNFRYAIMVSDEAAEHCPPDVLTHAEEYLHWNFPDPVAFAGTDSEQLHFFQTVRDEIEDQINIWLAEIGMTQTNY